MTCYFHLQALYPRSGFPRSCPIGSPVKAAAELRLTVLCAQWYSFVTATGMYLRVDRPCSSLRFIQELMWNLLWTKCNVARCYLRALLSTVMNAPQYGELPSQLTPLSAQTFTHQPSVRHFAKQWTPRRNP